MASLLPPPTISLQAKIINIQPYYNEFPADKRFGMRNRDAINGRLYGMSETVHEPFSFGHLFFYIILIIK
ncbi:hypothetical protein BWI96_15950 [Siphonobacter sp. SORGH_AS_0500]|nr:hypothetical protein BWI96_15950 [Siphonobacter sp. SORGH_AS_0500]